MATNTKEHLESLYVQLMVMGAPKHQLEAINGCIGLWHNDSFYGTNPSFNRASITLAKEYLALLKAEADHANQS